MLNIGWWNKIKIGNKSIIMFKIIIVIIVNLILKSRVIIDLKIDKL